ncbi:MULTISPECIES: hypothetical protein [Pirellulaceae]|nr:MULTISPECIES: hypothetical protein [Pirellulaceae]
MTLDIGVHSRVLRLIDPVTTPADNSLDFRPHELLFPGLSPYND